MANPYKTKRWINKRERVLKLHEYRCQECKRYGKNTEANTVHHANPLREKPEWWLETWNLVSLCKACHGKMHDRITDELTELGEEWRQRCERMRENGKESN